MYNYKKEFNKAFESTIKLGFPVEKVIFDDQMFFTGTNIEHFYALFRQVMDLAIQENHIEKQLANLQTINKEIYNSLPRIKSDKNYRFLALFNNCLNIHVATLNLINEHLNSNAYLTLGYYRIELLKKNFYEFSVSDFQKWLHDDESAFDTLDIHTWITLDTLEIIDLTLLTSIGFKTGDADLIGKIYHNYPDVIAQTDQLTYHPVIIATDKVLKAFNKSD